MPLGNNSQIFFDPTVAFYATNQFTQQQQSVKRQEKIMCSNQNQNPQLSLLAPVQNSDHIRVNPCSSVVSSTPFRLRKDLGFWVLSHGNDQAILKHEIGLSYISYLMDHPNEPIHGLALALKIRALRNGQPADSAELIQERALALDDAEAARRLFRKQLQLERLLDDEYLPEPDKHEILRQLEAIYAFQKKNVSRTSTVAQNASDAVGKSLKRLRARLVKANNADGSPNETLRAFAHYIRKHILTPSGRTGSHGGLRPPPGCGGFFICEKAAANRVVSARGSWTTFGDLKC
jgi:hypothetical protein